MKLVKLFWNQETLLLLKEMYILISYVLIQQEAMATFNKLRDEQTSLNGQLKDAKRMSPEILEEKIKKAEMKVECESLSIAEEKELNHQISQWQVSVLNE